MNGSKPMVNVTEAAVKLGISERTCYRWIEHRKLTAVKVADSVFVENQEIERVLEERSRVVPAR